MSRDEEAGLQAAQDYVDGKISWAEFHAKGKFCPEALDTPMPREEAAVRLQGLRDHYDSMK